MANQAPAVTITRETALGIAAEFLADTCKDWEIFRGKTFPQRVQFFSEHIEVGESSPDFWIIQRKVGESNGPDIPRVMVERATGIPS